MTWPIRPLTMEGTIYCSRNGCNAHAHVGAQNVAAGRLPPGFLRVIDYGDGNGDAESAFCGWDCVMKAAADVEPPTIISLDERKEEESG